MSVRATARLIGDLVYVPSLPNSPQMVVMEVKEEEKFVNAFWFSDDKFYHVGVFPAAALDRVEPKKTTQTAAKKRGPKPAAKRK